MTIAPFGALDFSFLESLALVRYNKTKRNSIAFEAITDELEKHYIRDFGAIQVFAKQSGGSIRLMITNNAALSLFNTYLS